MLHSKFIKSIAAIMLVMGIFTACKKDAFSEKDAIAAQTTLLQTKFSYDLAIKQIDLQIQRSGDSAKIVIQNLVNSGASALEILKQTNALAQILQNQTNLLAAYRYQDSLARNTVNLNEQLTKLRTLFNDSLTRAQTSATLAAQLSKQYSVQVLDNATSQPIVGAVVSVLPVGTSTFATATTDANGIAKFSTTLIIDPASNFIVTATNYSSALTQEFNFSTVASTSTVVVNGYTVAVPSKYRSVSLYNSGNTRNTIKGSVLGEVNLANGDASEAISGQLVTFTQTTLGVSYQFSALSDANGNYSVSVPDGFYTPTYPSTARVQQKLFVNAWQDQDQTTSLPRIDSIGTTLQTSSGFSSLSSGSGSGYYYTFPSDTINPTKVVFAAVNSNFGNNYSTFEPRNFTSGSSGNFTSRNAGTPKTDSLSNNTFQFGNNLFLNNQAVNHSTDNGIVYSQKSKYLPAKTPDSLTVTLVSLIPGWIVTAPKIMAPVDGNTGKISSLQLQKVLTSSAPFFLTPTAGSGGVFNNAVMFTPSGRQAFQNQPGIYGPYLASSATTVAPANSTNSFNLTGGNSYYLPIEYRNTIARDRTPR